MTAHEGDASPTLTPGARVGPYEVVALLGQGGMGQVWLARDTTLRRDVALKVLPPALAQDPGRLTRFRREAQLLASLNHPHIGSIYGFEESGQTPALVLELVDGQTLAAKLARGRLPVDETLRIAAQVADALEAAHERGIVHRDLKPSNVMLRTDGAVKVLDFGLATALRADSVDVTATAVTAAPGATLPGMMVGTPAYMAPEQARGETIDRRADIWAFGCVLYEMLTGRSAFGAPTVAEAITNVLAGRVNLDVLPADTPAPIRRLVGRCLHRSVRERLQHIGDARADIAEALADLSEVRATEAAGRIPRLSWRRHLLVFVGSTVLVILAVVWAFRVASVDTQAPPAAARFSLQAAEAVPLTANGNSTLPAISPDGRYVAYVQSDANGDSLWLRQLTAPTPNRIVEARAGVRIVAVTLSPDYADFVVREASRMRLERVPLVGGKARHLMDDVHSAIAWEPGGRRFVFVRLNSASETSLVVADADGTNERQLRRTVPPEHSFLTLVHPEGAGTGPAWSPDGATIAVPGLGFVDRVRTGFVMFVNATSGSVTQQVPYTPSGPGGAWVDGTSLLWSRPGEDHAPGQLWSLSYPSAALRRLTNDLSNYGPVALSADRDLLVTTQDDTDTSISVGDGSWTRSSDLDTSAAVPVVASIAAQVTWSGDRLLYSGLSGGRLGLWGIRLGEAPEELMRAAHSPAATADGGFIYIAGPGYSLWRADPNGRNATKLADDAYWPVMTPGGSAVFVSASRASQSVTLWSVPLDGGGPTQIADADARNPDVSGDGKRLAFVSSDPQPGGGQQRDAVLVCDLPDCASIRRLTPPGLPAGNVPIRWTRDGRGIAYVNALATGGPNIWVQPVDGSAATPLTRFTDRRSILSFAWSRDFARLAILRARPSTDIVLFKGLIIPAGQKEKVQ